MHVTSFLYDTDPGRLAAFEAEARGHFQEVHRIVRSAARKHLYGGDSCPVCARILQWEEAGAEREPQIIHPEPQCGWLPSGYPSTWRGWERGRAPFDPAGRLIAFAFYSRDGAQDDLIYTLPRAAEKLSGILRGDIEIVSAWEHDGAQRVWPVSGICEPGP